METDRTSDQTGPVPCRKCGYDVRGLPSDGVCPECEFPVDRSLSSDELKNSSPEYLAALHRGVVIILTSIIVMIMSAFAVAGVGIAISLGSGGTIPPWVEIVNQGINLITSLALVYGWWLFSAPDPAFTGREDGSTARKVVRVAILAAVAVNLVSFAFLLMPVNQGVLIGIIGLGILSLIIFAVRYFAEMLYLQWLTPRIPNWDSYKRAKLLIWLGPVLYTVGMLCLALGPLVALVLYWNLLDKIRKDIKVIRQTVPDMRV